ncbi:pentatricopeptide repeat-containing family protein [Striga asiatica]|uniref:Pentatricopeptide repeat-containing family protein n=1 Tax=Striga asiatica TaxID=4170 RepID=A0A5A7P640_STRAF|nr:pentatricopeptide repeat-containing family protein [Striga asiatica]
MAKLLRFRTLPFAQPSKPFLLSSLSSSSHPHSSSTGEEIPCRSKKSQSLSANIRNRSLYFLNGCKTSAHLFQIQAQLITSGLFQDPSFSGRLLKLSSSIIGDVCYTVLIFRSIDFPDSFCVNTVVKSYSCCKNYEKAVVFYVEMLRDGRFRPNCFTFPPLISACSKLGSLGLGQMCHGHALKFGVDGVLQVQNSLVHLYSCCRLMDDVRMMFDEMLTRDSVTWNTIIDGFAKVGEMGLAHQVFDAMPDKNVVSWNIMMTGYMNFRNPGNVLKLFRQMTVGGFVGNGTTLVQVIAACGRSNRLKEGKSVHGHLVKEFPGFNLLISTGLVDMYSKCGRVDAARVIFDKMPTKYTISWNAMILGHCIHGNPDEGLSLYKQMVDTKHKNEVEPDEVTFIGVLCACARLGMLTEGKLYFSQMIDVFRLKPNFAHYWCMANLMARVGLVHDAMNVMMNIPSDDDDDGVGREYSLWAALLGSCRFLGDVTSSEKIATALIERDPHNYLYYNLLVNVYALAGKWEEVARTKNVMRERGISKMPCCNLKDLNEIVCNVKVEDVTDLRTSL